jgi:uncharacterized protein YndB with AHSA1/START domain
MVVTVVLVLVLAVIAAILGVAAAKPKTFTVKRATVIAAAPEAIFPYLEDFRRWAVWSPYEDIDPGMKKTFGGPDKGVGATYGWDGDKKAGAGTMQITEAKAPGKLGLDLTMLRPFPAANHVEFFLTPLDEGTRTAWVMTGPQPFMSRVMSVFLSMDQLIGRDFEKGLARLKAAAETGS